MNKTLYIIGNGFDLAHGIKSSYVDYKTFLESQKLGINAEIYPQFLSDKSLNYWHEFEEQLSNYTCPDKLIDDISEKLISLNSRNSNNLYLDHSCNVIKQTIGECEYNVKILEIKQTFQNWVKQIDISLAKQKYKFNNNSIFLSFNYTTTLEDIYSINKTKISHIHGVKGDNNLIMGHSWSLNNNKIMSYEESVFYKKELDTESELLRLINSELTNLIEELYKNTHSVLEQSDFFYEFPQTISKIVVIGHSLSKVDMPYFHAIKDNVPKNTSWHVGYYSEEDCKRTEILKRELGISDDKFKKFASKNQFDLTKINYL